MRYKRDYSGKTADEWFAAGKWTGFLTQLPVGKKVVKECGSARDIQSIRVTASILNLSDDCPIRYIIGTESSNDRMIIIKTARK